MQTAIDEVRGFRAALEEAGVHAGGLHLEATPDDVVECVFDSSQNDEVGQRYSTLCDPRLNTAQATEVVSAW
ncbi:putative phenazine biosynthesis protein PhzC [Mycobacteroides abscessus subsp. abscessus]|nr:putative phenazine biosynthesis protein PhzC [Mycobacteroides abscessus subsp. abscessus]